MPEQALEETVLEALLADLGGAREPVEDLIQTYLNEAPGALDNLKTALTKSAPAELARAAHSLKSSSRLLGASYLAFVAQELETQSKSGNLVGASEKVQTILTLFPQVETRLKAWVGKS